MISLITRIPCKPEEYDCIKKDRDMKNDIRVKIDIDPSVDNPEVAIRANEETEFVRQIATSVQQCIDAVLSKIAVQQDADTEGSGNDSYTRNSAWTLHATPSGERKTTRFVDQWDIMRIYTEDRRLILCTGEGEFWMRTPLREIEQSLNPDWFVRISRYEIVNINMVSGFDMSIAGTIRVVFENGSSTWVARRYVRSIEKRLSEI